MVNSKLVNRGLLLEWLAKELNCFCLSDLKLAEMKQGIYQKLHQMDANGFTKDQWRETADYLIGATEEEKDASMIRDELLSWCLRSDGNE